MLGAEGGGTTLTLTIKNTGLTPIYDYADMDFIVAYVVWDEYLEPAQLEVFIAAYTVPLTI